MKRKRGIRQEQKLPSFFCFFFLLLSLRLLSSPRNV